MTADSKSTPDRPLVEDNQTSLELDVPQQVGIESNAVFPGLNPAMSNLTGSPDPGRDAQTSSDALSPMPAKADQPKKKKRKSAVPQSADPAYVRVLASDSRFAFPVTVKKKKKVQFESSL